MPETRRRRYDFCVNQFDCFRLSSDQSIFSFLLPSPTVAARLVVAVEGVSHTIYKFVVMQFRSICLFVDAVPLGTIPAAAETTAMIVVAVMIGIIAMIVTALLHHSLHLWHLPLHRRRLPLHHVIAVVVVSEIVIDTDR
jgi:hypothetical protein